MLCFHFHLYQSAANPLTTQFELHRFTYMDFFQQIYTIGLYNLQFAETMDAELRIWRVDCKVIHRFLTPWKICAPNPVLF